MQFDSFLAFIGILALNGLSRCSLFFALPACIRSYLLKCTLANFKTQQKRQRYHQRFVDSLKIAKSIRMLELSLLNNDQQINLHDRNQIALLVANYLNHVVFIVFSILFLTIYSSLFIFISVYAFS